VGDGGIIVVELAEKPEKNQKLEKTSSSLLAGYLGKKKNRTDDRRNGPPSSVNDNPSKCRPAGSGGYIDKCACVTEWTGA